MTNISLSSYDLAPAVVSMLKGNGNLQQPGTKTLTDTPHFYQALCGTIVPPEWKSLYSKNGKKLSRGALELYAIIVSWYNCKKVRDKETGRVTFVQKFEGDELRKNYDYFTKELDRSQEQVRRYFAELKAANLVTMELRTVWHKNWRYSNTLCIKLNKEAPHFKKESGAYHQNNNEAISPQHVINQLQSAELKKADLNQRPSLANDICLKDSNYNTYYTEVSNPRTANTCFLQDKKIWTLPCKKVGFAAQKSGVYIENNNSKTKKNRSDLNKSDFLSKNFVSSIAYKSKINQENVLYKIFPTQLQLLTNFKKLELEGVKESNTPSNKQITAKKEDSIDKAISKNIDHTSSSIITTQTTSRIHSLPRKPMVAFHPLTEDDAIFLRNSCGRPFNLNFINKLLLKLSADYPDRGFYKKSLLLSYMTDVLRGEKRDAYEVNRNNFNFKAKPGSFEYEAKTQNDYLNAIELSPETNISTKIKRRIIGLFNESDAYCIITSCRLPYIADNHSTALYTIEVPNSITEAQRSILTQAAQDVLGKNTEVIFKEKEDKKAGQGSFMKGSNNSSLNSKPIVPSSPLWQKIREALTKRYGEAVDRSWFSNCDIEKAPNSKQILIKASTKFIKDWIKQNYSSAIEEILSELSKTAQELLPDIDMTDKSYKWLEWGVSE